MRSLGKTQLYKQALDALHGIADVTGNTDQVKAIAKFLLFSSDAAVSEPLFPFVGELGDPRDAAVVSAYESAFQQIINGDDDFE